MAAPAKAVLKIEGGSEIPCMFNPADLTITKANTWQGGEAKGTNAPELRFQSGKSATLKMNLTFDTTAEGTPVTDYTDKLLKLMNVDKSLPGTDPKSNTGRPRWVQFEWGPTKSMKAVIDNMTIKFTYFASSGMPLRAKVDLSLTQWHDEEGVLPLQNPTSFTPSLHSVHRLRPGETLDRVAAEHYGDATRWRLIAEANHILDPLRLDGLSILAVPEQGLQYRNGNGGQRD